MPTDGRPTIANPLAREMIRWIVAETLETPTDAFTDADLIHHAADLLSAKRYSFGPQLARLLAPDHQA